jgi:ADP-heptose:LPS heptosyltransferase
MNRLAKPSTVLIRLDKIGDLIATLPVDQTPALKQHKITWVVESGVRFLCDLAEPARNCLSISLLTPWNSFKQLLAFLKSEKPERVVIFYAPWWVSLAAWWARVPHRVGRKSQWHSYLFLNAGLRQSRSQSLSHEADYNWELIHFALYTPAEGEPPVLKIQAPFQPQLLEKLDLSAKNFTVVHPGMAGSAKNWPQSHYNSLIESLTDHGIVAVTGTKADDPWLTQIRPRWKGHPRVRWLQNQLNITELVFVLQSAKNVVAPSTGVLHLAASSGTPVIGLYSNVLAHHPRRWAPRGLGVKILTPPAGSTDMSQIRVEQVLENLT